MSNIRTVFNDYLKIYTDDYGVYVISDPLCNCQTYSLSGVDNLLGRGVNAAKEVFIETYKFVQKNQILVDVSFKYLNTLEAVFPNKADWILKAPYKNSTGSNMVICIIKTRSLKDNIENTPTPQKILVLNTQLVSNPNSYWESVTNSIPSPISW